MKKAKSEIEILRKISDNDFLVNCAFCEGKGTYPIIAIQDADIANVDPCPICKGGGINRIHADVRHLIKCGYCGGGGKGWNEDGHFMGELCPACIGTGFLRPHTISTDFPDELDPFWSFLHPLVVKVASSRFNSNHYADAVEAALKEVNTIVKEKVKTAIGQELDGASLMQRALSLDNPIILMADISTDSGKDIQKGYIQIFSGAMTGIRNPKAHENISLDKRRAIHLLFLSSLLMEKVFEFEHVAVTRESKQHHKPVNS